MHIYDGEKNPYKTNLNVTNAQKAASQNDTWCISDPVRQTPTIPGFVTMASMMNQEKEQTISLRYCLLWTIIQWQATELMSLTSYYAIHHVLFAGIWLLPWHAAMMRQLVCLYATVYGPAMSCWTSPCKPGGRGVCWQEDQDHEVGESSTNNDRKSAQKSWGLCIGQDSHRHSSRQPETQPWPSWLKKSP